MNAMIKMSNVSVEFPIYETSNRSLKKTIINATSGGKFACDASNHIVINALKDVNIELTDGDKVGVIGKNGSGKSTLLKVIAGIYMPINGDIRVQGKIASLLDISMGLDSEATGFENIYLKSLIAGLKPRDIRNKLDKIAELSMLGDYLHLPIRTYSSGMRLRLGFAISTNIDADIVLMDEWLSVGDNEFNKLATDKLNELINKASILVLATHNHDLVSNVCNKVLTLEDGRVKSFDDI